MLNREEEINPKDYGLNSRLKVKRMGNMVILEKIRKSRIIMKDVLQIEEQIAELQKAFPEHRIALRIGGPICSKSVKYLSERSIEILESE